MALSPHDRRLARDMESVNELKMQSDLIDAVPVGVIPGRLPDAWEVTFRCRGIVGIDRNRNPLFGEDHRVSIALGADYPRQPPGLLWLTPIWHPNIMHTPPRIVCINSWQPGRTLAETIRMLGEMVQYKNYHAAHTPPHPLDNEVATWVRWAEMRGIVGVSNPVDDRELLRPRRVTVVMPPTPGAVRRVDLTSSSKPSARIRITGGDS